VKLRKQTPAKIFVVAATIGLVAAFFGLIRSEPRIKAETSAAPVGPAIDYERFFAPGASGGGAATSLPPHTRTRGS
jgi:hypothetical protein